MKINVKALVGALATAFAISGWALYATSGSKPTTLTQEESESTAPSNSSTALPSNSWLTNLIKDNQRASWEINTRDAIIDYKNQQIEALEKENKQLDQWLKEYEEYADQNEIYMNELEKLAKVNVQA